MKEKRLIPIPDWNHFHPGPTQAGLRYYIFNADLNGFDKVIKRVGRRVLLDEEAFFEWIDARPPSIKHYRSSKGVDGNL